MRGVLFLLAASFAACGGERPPQSEDSGTSASLDLQQWSLPQRLNEISGLALTADERLLAVTDEIAVVYEIDYADGRLVKAFAFGTPPVRDDFEGIEVRDGTVWLMTSNGRLLAGPEGANGANVDFREFDTRLRDDCELEGLSTNADDSALMLVCKEARQDKNLRLYAWDPDTGDRQRVDLPEKAMEDAVGRKSVNPSGIAVAPESGNFLVVAARQYVVFELAADGRFIDVIMRLDEKRHRQAEGIALTRDGRLLIADEAGNGSARLAVYRMSHGE